MKLKAYFKLRYNIEIDKDEIPTICRLASEDLEMQLMARLTTFKAIFDKLFDIDIAKKSRSRRYTDARELFIHFAATFGYTFQDIGAAINRNHSTVHHYYHKHADDMKYTPSYKKKYEIVKRQLSREEI